MAALGSLATLASAGVGLYRQSRVAEASASNDRAQAEIARQQEVARQQQLTIQQQAERRSRSEQVARTVASARARFGAAGLSPEDGSAATVTEGLRAEAAAGAVDSDALFRARLSSGRASLLNPDASLTTVLRAVPSFGNALRNLLD